MNNDIDTLNHLVECFNLEQVALNDLSACRCGWSENETPKKTGKKKEKKKRKEYKIFNKSIKVVNEDTPRGTNARSLDALTNAET
jgi:hypothetical protein